MSNEASKREPLQFYMVLDHDPTISNTSLQAVQHFDNFTVGWYIDHPLESQPSMVVKTTVILMGREQLLQVRGHVKFLHEGHIMAHFSEDSINEVMASKYNIGFKHGQERRSFEIAKLLGVVSP